MDRVGSILDPVKIRIARSNVLAIEITSGLRMLFADKQA